MCPLRCVSSSADSISALSYVDHFHNIRFDSTKVRQGRLLALCRGVPAYPKFLLKLQGLQIDQHAASLCVPNMR